MTYNFNILPPPYIAYRIVQQIYSGNRDRSVCLFDHIPRASYPFFCQTCQRGLINIRVRLADSNRLNWYYHTHYQAVFPTMEVVKYGGIGVYGNLICCTNCETHFYIGLGYDEPNNGRDVFELHCIWEIAPI